MKPEIRNFEQVEQLPLEGFVEPIPQVPWNLILVAVGKTMWMMLRDPFRKNTYHAGADIELGKFVLTKNPEEALTVTRRYIPL